MKIFKKILLAITVLLGLAAISGMFMSSKFDMERSVVIKADEQNIFDQVNILKNWEKWSPWFKMDPKIKISYNNTPSGAGAMYSWNSESSQTGNGSMTITECVPYRLIRTTLDFKENGKASSDFKLEKTDGGIKLTWTFDSDGGNNPFKKLMMHTMGKMFMDKTYDEGLASIKQISESMPAPAPVPHPAPVDSTAVEKK